MRILSLTDMTHMPDRSRSCWIWSCVGLWEGKEPWSIVCIEGGAQSTIEHHMADDRMSPSLMCESVPIPFANNRRIANSLKHPGSTYNMIESFFLRFILFGRLNYHAMSSNLNFLDSTMPSDYLYTSKDERNHLPHKNQWFFQFSTDRGMCIWRGLSSYFDMNMLIGVSGLCSLNRLKKIPGYRSFLKGSKLEEFTSIHFNF